MASRTGFLPVASEELDRPPDRVLADIDQGLRLSRACWADERQHWHCFLEERIADLQGELRAYKLLDRRALCTKPPPIWFQVSVLLVLRSSRACLGNQSWHFTRIWRRNRTEKGLFRTERVEAVRNFHSIQRVSDCYPAAAAAAAAAASVVLQLRLEADVDLQLLLDEERDQAAALLLPVLRPLLVKVHQHQPICRKRCSLFQQLYLCLSRACLGK